MTDPIDISGLTPREIRLVQAQIHRAILLRYPHLESHLNLLHTPDGVDLALATGITAARKLIASGTPATFEPGGAYTLAAPKGVSPQVLRLWERRLRLPANPTEPLPANFWTAPTAQL